MNQVRKNRIALLVLFASLLLAGCSDPQPSVEQAPIEPTEPPFQNSEPEKYQTFVLQRSASGTVKFLVVRDGDKWRIDADIESPRRTASLRLGDKDYVLDFASKSYGEYTTGHGFDERAEMVKDITYGLMNARDVAAWHADGKVYRMKDDKGREVIVNVDDSGRATAKEIHKVDGDSRTLEMGVSLEDFKLEADPTNFEIPKDFKKVPLDEMKKILTTPR